MMALFFLIAIEKMRILLTYSRNYDSILIVIHKYKEIFQMNYEKIIVELLSRIQTLEEKVDLLMKEKEPEKEGPTMTINDIREYINELKKQAKAEGKSSLILRSGDIHKDLKLKNWMPSVCKAMYDCMRDGDVILHTTPSGNSSTIEIEYGF